MLDNRQVLPLAVCSVLFLSCSKFESFPDDAASLSVSYLTVMASNFRVRSPIFRRKTGSRSESDALPVRLCPVEVCLALLGCANARRADGRGGGGGMLSGI